MTIYLAALAFTLAVAYGMVWSKSRREKAAQEADELIRRGRETGPHGR